MNESDKADKVPTPLLMPNSDDIIAVPSQPVEENPVEVEMESSEYFLAMFMLIRYTALHLSY
jgi:hypothetical protein